MKKLLLSILIVFAVKCVGQVSVMNFPLMPYSVTPESMLSANLMNQGAAQRVSIVSRLFNLNNELLLTVRSSVFMVQTGLNTGFSAGRSVMSVEYGAGSQAAYIKTSHGLPSGIFRTCVDVYTENAVESSDEYCDELQSEYNQFLYLVFPSDQEIVPTIYPVLTWTHSEPFNLLSQGETFRMIVAEIKSGQSAEEAISMNSPMLFRDFLLSHSLPYPYDAKALEPGKKYAWKVEKVANGVVLNKTETWEFSVAGPDPIATANYVTLTKVQDASFYTAENNKIYFRFSEEYNGGSVACTVTNSTNETMVAEASNKDQKKDSPNYKQHGFNQYEIDLDGYNLKKGFYTLQVTNAQNEIFLLKFYIL